MENLNLKKFFLYLLICSIGFSALMGISAILWGEFGEFQGKILGTTLTVVGTSILGLACGAFLETIHQRNSPRIFVPVAGIILAIVSSLILLWLIWASSSLGDVNAIYKFLAVCSIFAFSFAQLSLLSLANLSKRFQWAITTEYLVVFVLASIISAVIVIENNNESDFVFRTIGILAVIDAALTVMIPIFHRLSRTEFVENETPSINKIDTEIAKLKTEIARLEKQKEDIQNTVDKSVSEE